MKDITVDEIEVIKLLRRGQTHRLKELAKTYVEAPLEQKSEEKVTDTVVSHGLKLKLKKDKGMWKKGSLWVVTDPKKHPLKRNVPCSADQLLVTHTTDGGAIEDMVILKSELDDVFELM